MHLSFDAKNKKNMKKSDEFQDPISLELLKWFLLNSVFVYEDTKICKFCGNWRNSF